MLILLNYTIGKNTNPDTTDTFSNIMNMLVHLIERLRENTCTRNGRIVQTKVMFLCFGFKKILLNFSTVDVTRVKYLE